MIFRILAALAFIGFLLMPVSLWVETMKGNHYLIGIILKIILIIWSVAIITTIFIIIFTV